MKRKNLSLFFITLLISLLASCRDELSTAGGKWVESSLRTIQTDTCTVRLSTILSDSLATSGDTVCQIGTIDDPVWGKIKAAFYAEYGEFITDENGRIVIRLHYHPVLFIG